MEPENSLEKSLLKKVIEALNELKKESIFESKKRKKMRALIKELQPIEKLEAYSSFYKELAPQGSEEWHANRKIGGSSAHKILKTPREAARLLLGLDTFTGNISTQWGSMMEKVATKFLSRFIEIKEFGSIPGYNTADGIVRTSYSPDGIFLFAERAKELAELCGFSESLLLEQICLLEIKCPYLRAPKSEVPEYYIPQIQLGLSTTICSNCLYSEFYFKRSSISDFNFYKRSSTTFTKFQPQRDPIAIGFIGLYGEENKKTHEILPPASSPFQDQDFPQLEKEILSVSDLFEADRVLTLQNPSCSDELKAHFLTIKFPQHKESFAKYYRSSVPHCKLADFGATNNYFYDYCDPKEFIGPFFYSELLLASDNKDAYACRDFFESELERFEQSHSDAYGIVCYKLFEINAFVVEKKNYSKEIIEILKFSLQLDKIKVCDKSSWESEINKTWPEF